MKEDREDTRLETQGTKPRKAYVLTKTRESWSEEEHGRFVEALRLYARDWKRIEEHVGTKSATQIRSHAQKHFHKAVQQGEEIPPPRAKRRSAAPTPRSRPLPQQQQQQQQQQHSTHAQQRQPSHRHQQQLQEDDYQPVSQSWLRLGEGSPDASLFVEHVGQHQGSRSTSQAPQHSSVTTEQGTNGMAELMCSMNPAMMGHDAGDAGLLSSLGMLQSPLLGCPTSLMGQVSQGLPLGGYFPGTGGFLGGDSSTVLWAHQQQQLHQQQMQQQQQQLQQQLTGLPGSASFSRTIAASQAAMTAYPKLSDGAAMGGGGCKTASSVLPQQQVPFETLCGSGIAAAAAAAGGGGCMEGATGRSSSSSNLAKQVAPQQQQLQGGSNGATATATATTSNLFSILPGGTRVEGGVGAAEFSHLMNMTAVASAQGGQQQHQEQRQQMLMGASSPEVLVVGRQSCEGGMEGMQQGTASSEEDQSIGSNQQGSGTDGDGSGSIKDGSRTNGQGHTEMVKVNQEAATYAGIPKQPLLNAQQGPMHSSGRSVRGGSGSGATTPTTAGVGGSGSGSGTKRPHSCDAAGFASTDDEESRLADVVLRPHPKGRRTSHTSRQAGSSSGTAIEPSPSPAPDSPPHQKHPSSASLPVDTSQPALLGRSSVPHNSSSSSYSHRVRARSSSAQSQSRAYPMPAQQVHQREGTPVALGPHRLARTQQQQQQQQMQLVGLHPGPHNTAVGAGWVDDSSRSSSKHRCHATSLHNSQGNSGPKLAAATQVAPPGVVKVEGCSGGEHNSRSVPQTDFAWMIREFEQIDDDSGPCYGYNWVSTGPTGGAEQQQQQQQQVAMRQQQQQLLLQQQREQQHLSSYLRSSTPPYASSMGSGHTTAGNVSGAQELHLQQHGNNSTVMQQHGPGSCKDGFRAAGYPAKLEEGGHGAQVVVAGPAAAAVVVSQHWHQHQQQQQQQQLSASVAAAATAAAAAAAARTNGGDSGEGDVGSNSTDDSDPGPGTYSECGGRVPLSTADTCAVQPPTNPTPASFEAPGRVPNPLPFEMAPTPDLPRSISPSPASAALDSLPLPLEPLLPFGPRSSPPDSATLMHLDTPSPPAVVSNDSALGAISGGSGGGGIGVSMGGGGGSGGIQGESENEAMGNGPQTLAQALSLPEGCPAAPCTQSSGSMADIDALLN